MKFEIPRITAKFGIINVRKEKRGRSKKVEAEDIPITIIGGPDLLDMLFPHEDFDTESKTRVSSSLFDDEGHVMVPTLSLISKRKPEGLAVTIYDHPKKPLELKTCRLTPPEVELATPNLVTMTAKIQLTEPTDVQMNRLRRLMDESAEIEVIAEISDMFGSGSDGGDDKGGE